MDALHHRLVTLHSLPMEQRKGKRLRVVTGRGNHSSGGEATVPRTVENYLLQVRVTVYCCELPITVA